MNIVTIGFYTEGTTDDRFLHSIIKRTFDAVALECATEIEVYEPVILPGIIGTFTETAVALSQKAFTEGLLVLCIHTDADASNDHEAFQHKITPAFTAIQTVQPAGCTILVAIVPVRMSEAWILADKALLKEEIGTNSNDRDLGLDRHPEAYADPKAAIEEAIRRAFEHRSRRQRQQVTIGELYLPLGQKLELDRLATLPSYQKFREGVRQAFRNLNYLH
jgi:hypothetical protein